MGNLKLDNLKLDDLVENLFENGLLISIVAAAAIVACAVLLGKLLSGALRRVGQSQRFNPVTITFLRRSLLAVLALLAVYGVFMQIKPLQSLARSLITGSGLLVVVVGFAAQQAIANIVGGFFITVFRPFSIHDRIRLIDQNIVGFVEDITLRHTVVRTFENNRVIVPNSIMNAAIVENSYYQDDKVCNFLELGVCQHSDLERAMAIMSQEVRAHKDFYDNRNDEQRAGGIPAVMVRLVGLDRGEARLQATVWARNASVGYDMTCELRLSIKKKFEAEGIELMPAVVWSVSQ